MTTNDRCSDEINVWRHVKYVNHGPLSGVMVSNTEEGHSKTSSTLSAALSPGDSSQTYETSMQTSNANLQAISLMSAMWCTNMVQDSEGSVAGLFGKSSGNASGIQQALSQCGVNLGAPTYVNFDYGLNARKLNADLWKMGYDFQPTSVNRRLQSAVDRNIGVDASERLPDGFSSSLSPWDATQPTISGSRDSTMQPVPLEISQDGKSKCSEMLTSKSNQSQPIWKLFGDLCGVSSSQGNVSTNHLVPDPTSGNLPPNLPSILATYSEPGMYLNETVSDLKHLL